ncbi:MAG: NAD(P)H-quinone oxidoreductase [Mycobacterium sp.]|nr:NAD(P)H-quinone oxidoreductase [Mycobacterium sp.]
MRGILAGGTGQLRWQDVPDVVVGPAEVLIDVHTAGVNRADLLQAAGKYPPPPGASDVLGLEVSGTVAEVGVDVGGFVAGQRVCALLAGGGYAERVAVPAGQVMPVPAGVTLADAAALPEAACTVWSNLVRTARLARGEVVLVHGGASGIGTHAVQVARALGATVAVTAGSAQKLRQCAELGAQILINHRAEDFVERIRESTDEAGCDVILDIMGATYFERNLAALSADGRLVIIGMQGGVKTELNIATLIGKRLSVSGTALRGRPSAGGHGKAAIVDDVVSEVWPMVADGRVRPVIGARFPIDRADDAHRLLQSGQVCGKVLLTVSAG